MARKVMWTESAWRDLEEVADHLTNRDRRTFDRELLRKGLTDIYITFAGPPVPEGYAVIF
jgi:plasmid stabilization system protein ParE